MILLYIIVIFNLISNIYLFYAAQRKIYLRLDNYNFEIWKEVYSGYENCLFRINLKTLQINKF